MIKITIRKMIQDDLGIVSELAMLANPHATKEKYIEHLSDELKENPDLSFVALSNDKAVGFVQADVRNDISILQDIAVHRQHQRKGIGKRLLTEELQALKKKKVKVILAQVHYKCSSAIPFYYKHGFRLSGCMQDCFGFGHDAIILKLSL